MEPWDIALCAQLSCALEVACPKPGNVNRYHDFQDTTLEHYLISAVAVGDTMRKAAEAGFKYGSEGRYSEIGIGGLVLKAVADSQKWHRGGNTNLGMAALLVPLCASYGSAINAAARPKDAAVRRILDSIMQSTTPDDAINFYRAVKEAKPGGLGKQQELDVVDPESEEKIKRKGITLYQVLKISSHDSIAAELTGQMRITFEVGSPAIRREYLRTGSFRQGVIRGYMEILSKIPDSLIVRKKGAEVAEEVSKEAGRILRQGMQPKELEAFDRMLREEGNALNPGTTADLTAASIMVCLLKGVRP
jgi:triphosphoribosyl-dephospho-CoA synthase